MSVIKGVNFWSFLFASQMGGWAMVVLDMVYAGWFGLFGIFPGTKDWGWVLKHQIDDLWGGLTGFLYNPPEREE